MRTVVSHARRIFNETKNGVSTKYNTYIQGRTMAIGFPNAMHDTCIKTRILIVLGVLVVVSMKAYNDSQNEKLTSPAKILEHIKR